MRRVLALCALVAVAGCGGHSPQLELGAVEDASKWAPDPAVPMRLAAAAGLPPGVPAAARAPRARGTADPPPPPPAARGALAAGADAMPPGGHVGPAAPPPGG